MDYPGKHSEIPDPFERHPVGLTSEHNRAIETVMKRLEAVNRKAEEFSRLSRHRRNAQAFALSKILDRKHSNQILSTYEDRQLRKKRDIKCNS